MPYLPHHFRVFLGSPGDVPDERALALKLLDDLVYDPSLRGRVTLEAVAWDRKGAGAPLLASMTPQEAINAGLPRPSECDIVIVIFWSRMGTPLPREYIKHDGTGYLSGTEFEFEDAMAGCRETGRPFILLYRRVEPPSIALNDPALQQKKQQYDRVEQFFAQFKEQDTGAVLAGHNSYLTPDEFRSSLESHLRHLLEVLLRQIPERHAVLPSSAGAHGTLPRWEGSPFPGLRAFTWKDASIFFGRGRETDALVKRVVDEARRFVAVVGASGSGKSSLVGAGLIPRLQGISGGHGWSVITCTPDQLGSGDPFAAVAAALVHELPQASVPKMARTLRDNPQALADALIDFLVHQTEVDHLLLFIDQFEELFTTVDPMHRGRFIEMISRVVANSDRIRTVMTLRGDFFGRCIEVPELANLLSDSTYPLAAPGMAALLDMITRPADRADLRFEDALAQRILDDTGDEPGSLALMAYTLDELYRTCAGSRILTFEAYDRLGGVQGAIGKRSETVFGTLSEAEREAMPHVFRELVEVDERGTATRQRANLSRVAATEAAYSLVLALTDARLLVTSKGEQNNDPFVEVAHEALFRSWERLASWIKDTEEDLRLLRQIRIAAREWDENGRREDYLWSQERLEPVYSMRERLNVDFEPLIQDFIRPETERLLEEFQSDNRYFRQRPIIERWAEIGRSAAPALITALQFAKTLSSRGDIHAALRNIGDQAVRLLIRALQDEDARKRALIVEALGKTKNMGALEPLARMLRDPEEKIRESVASALGSLGSLSVLPPLTLALQDESPGVRLSALIAIEEIEEPSITPILLDALKNKDPVVRKTVAEMLGDLGDKPGHQYYNHQRDKWIYTSGKLRTLLAEHGAVQALTHALKDNDVEVRRNAARALGKLGDVSAAPALIVALRDADATVSSQAAQALGATLDGATIPPLIASLTDTRAEVRQGAAQALAEIIGRIIEKPFQSDDPLLGKLRTLLAEHGAVQALTHALKDNDVEVRRNAARALGKLGDKSAVPALITALRDLDEYVQSGAAGSLGKLGDKSAVPALIDALQDTQGGVGHTAAQALGEIGDKSVGANLLSAVLSTRHHKGYYADRFRTAIIDSLAKLGNADAIRSIGQAFEGSDATDVQRRVRQALLRLDRG